MDENTPITPGRTNNLTNGRLAILMILFMVFGVLAGLFVVFAVSRRTTQISMNDKLPIAATVTPVPAITKTPAAAVVTGADNERILSAKLTDSCEIEITTSEKVYVVSSGLSDAVKNCQVKKIGEISPSGRYLAYDDLSGGLDSVMAVFPVRYEKRVVLDVWGTSTIMDYMFLPDDRLATINGYPSLFEEQWLTLFDIPAFMTDLSANIDAENFYFRPTNPYFRTGVDLPNTGNDHEELAVSDGKIQTMDKSGRLLVQYDLRLLSESSQGRYVISSADAVMLVREADKVNINPVDLPRIEVTIDRANCTFDFWRVNITERATQEIIRAYEVNSRTGEVRRVDTKT